MFNKYCLFQILSEEKQDGERLDIRNKMKHETGNKRIMSRP